MAIKVAITADFLQKEKKTTMSAIRFTKGIALGSATIMMLMAACGPAPTAAPTATQPPPPTTVPPTATPVPPTATAAPPTATPIPPTATAAPQQTGGVIGDVIARMGKETAYRMEMTITAKGLPTTGGVGDQPIIFAKGDINGKNSHMAMGGVIFALFTGDPDKTMEMITVDKDVYVKGPAPLFGAPDSKWYTMTGGSSSVPSNPAAGIFGSGDAQVKDTDFTKTGTEALDGKKCDIYTGNKDALQKAYDGMGTGGESNSKIEAGEYKVWICDDGYLHKLNMTLKTDFAGNGTMLDMNILARMYDFGSNIKVERPANPQAPKEPDFGALLPTPTPKK